MDSNAPSQGKPTPTTFQVGQLVKWGKYQGNIRHVDIDYITICIKTYPNDDSYRKRNQREVCLLCFTHQWNDVIIQDNN